LQDELLRISTSAFQNEAYHDLKDSISAISDDSDLFHCLLQHIYHLLPIVSATFGETVYSYKESKWQDPSDLLGESLYVGSEWIRSRLNSEVGGDEGKAISHDVLPVPILGSLKLNLRRNSNDREISALTKQHRAIQVVEQQMQYLENLRNALHDETRRKEDDRQKCAMVVYEYLLRMDAKTQDDIRRTEDRVPAIVLNTSLTTPLVAVGDHFAPPRLRSAKGLTSLARYLEQAYPDDSHEQRLSTVQALIRPSLLLSLSEYFETGPGKLMTHKISETKVIGVSWADAVSYTKSLYGRITAQLDILERNIREARLRARLNSHKTDLELRAVLDEFHHGLIGEFPTQKALRLEELRSSLEIDSFSLRNGMLARLGESTAPEKYGKRSRVFGICPGCILMDFIDQYEQDLKKHGLYPGSGEFKHSRRLRRDVSYASPYHGEEQLPVYLVEQLLFLPYAINDETGWMKSELVNCWLLTGESIGSLYVFSSLGPGNAPNAKLLIAHPKEKTIDRSLEAIS
jgi:hypothetical protein